MREWLTFSTGIENSFGVQSKLRPLMLRFELCPAAMSCGQTLPSVIEELRHGEAIDSADKANKRGNNWSHLLAFRPQDYWRLESRNRLEFPAGLAPSNDVRPISCLGFWAVSPCLVCTQLLMARAVGKSEKVILHVWFCERFCYISHQTWWSLCNCISSPLLE